MAETTEKVTEEVNVLSAAAAAVGPKPPRAKPKSDAAPSPAASPPDPDMDGDDVAAAEQPPPESNYGTIGDAGLRRTMPKPQGFVPAIERAKGVRPEAEAAPRGVTPDVSDDIEILSPEEQAEVDEWIARRFPEGADPIYFGAEDFKLKWAKRPGFHRHWFNDDGKGRIADAKRAGYDHVLDDRGSPVSRVVGVSAQGGGLTAFLMETPQKWHDLSLAAQQKRIDGIDADILGGDIGRKDGDERYVPNQGNAIKISRS